jgi:hypothetical protein
MEEKEARKEPRQGKEPRRGKQPRKGKEPSDEAHPPRQVRLPGFVTGEEVGLGEVIKRATSIAGFRPCGGCSKRAAALDRRLVFVPRR